MKLNSWERHERVIELLREQGESVDGPAGVTGYDVIYRSESLFSTHANVFTIGRHLVCGDDEWAVSVDSSETRGDDIVSVPVIHTSYLAQRVFKEFGLDGDAMASFVVDLVVPARGSGTRGQLRLVSPAGPYSSKFDLEPILLGLAKRSRSPTVRPFAISSLRLRRLIALPLAIWRQHGGGAPSRYSVQQQSGIAQQQSEIAQRGLLNERYQKVCGDARQQSSFGSLRWHLRPAKSG